MTEIGETVERVDALIKDTKRFQKLCDVDIERAEEVVAIGKYVKCLALHLFDLHRSQFFLLHFQASNL